VFGFGRRICPGNYLAENTLFLAIAQSLAVFSTQAGKAINRDPETMFQSGLVSHPKPFESIIQPRSPHHENLIKSLEKTYPWRESDGEILRDIATNTKY
jgi:hypothetical protein